MQTTSAPTSIDGSLKLKLEEFIKFAVPRIEQMMEVSLKPYPKISLVTDRAATKTLGHNDVMGNHIVTRVDGRHPADICRTLGHELIHTGQKRQGVLTETSGETGSDHENQANAMAGILLREWGQQSPAIFE